MHYELCNSSFPACAMDRRKLWKVWTRPYNVEEFHLADCALSTSQHCRVSPMGRGDSDACSLRPCSAPIFQGHLDSSQYIVMAPSSASATPLPSASNPVPLGTISPCPDSSWYTVIVHRDQHRKALIAGCVASLQHSLPGCIRRARIVNARSSTFEGADALEPCARRHRMPTAIAWRATLARIAHSPFDES